MTSEFRTADSANTQMPSVLRGRAGPWSSSSKDQRQRLSDCLMSSTVEVTYGTIAADNATLTTWTYAIRDPRRNA